MMRINYSKFNFINVCVLLSLVDKIGLGREPRVFTHDSTA